MNTYRIASGLFLLPAMFFWAGFAPAPAPQPTPTPTPLVLAPPGPPTSGSLSSFFPAWSADHPTASVYSSLASTPHASELETLVAWTTQRQQDLLAQPGWLHRYTRHFVFSQKTPNSTAPAADFAYVLEGWYHINKAGQIDQAREHILDEAGSLLQSREYAAASGDWSVVGDLPFVVHLTDLSLPFDLDFGFSRLAQSVSPAEGQPEHDLTRHTIYENCWYLGEEFILGLDGTAAQGFGAGLVKINALFNPDTGKLRTLQIFELTPGDLRLVERIELAVEERQAEPPPGF